MRAHVEAGADFYRDDFYMLAASWLLDTFDLAPASSLQPLKDAVRDLAREGFVSAAQ